MGDVCSSSPYKSTEPLVVSTLSELLSKQLISVLAAHALSEQKLFRDSISDIVAEKNQKNEKLLTDKTER